MESIIHWENPVKFTHIHNLIKRFNLVHWGVNILTEM